MVIKDYLTKYVWLIPLKTKTAQEVAEAFPVRFKTMRRFKTVRIILFFLHHYLTFKIRVFPQYSVN
jgi:hypothetical protein